mmetsp:Transcript_5523/g.16374  ORF Transcript_5523/g.16374 Transcript_5523/m.16374 type:complete len:302 (-) Transcript_5523:195-1100(-)
MSMTVSTPDINKFIQTDKATPKMQFPWVLHRLVDEADDAVVSWSADGASFKIHDRDAFMQVASSYFKLKKFRSFTRQLNMWNFSYFSTGSNKGQYQHPKFIRGMQWLCNEMQREKCQKRSSSSAAVAASAAAAKKRTTTTTTKQQTVVQSSVTAPAASRNDHAEQAAPPKQSNKSCPQHLYEMKQKQEQQHEDSLGHALMLDLVTSSSGVAPVAPPAPAAASNADPLMFGFQMDSPPRSSNNAFFAGQQSSGAVDGPLQAAPHRAQGQQHDEDELFTLLFKHLETKPLNDLDAMHQWSVGI